MGKKSSPAAPAPDPLIGQAAQGNIELGRESLAFARQQYEEGKIRQVDLDALTKQVADSALNSQTKAEQWAQQDRDKQSAAYDKYEGYADQDRIKQQGLQDKYTSWADQDRAAGKATQGWADGLAGNLLDNASMYEQTFGKEAQRQSRFGQEEVGRYQNLFRPVQDRIVNDSMTWDSNDRLESEAGKAKADIVANAAQQRQAQQRQMASMGVNPNSGRFAGVERATDTLTALGAAGAQNASRDNVRAQGIQMRGQAAQLGQQVLANGQQANQMSMDATSRAQAARQSGTQLAMGAKNLGLAAAGVGNTSAGLSSGAQAGGNAGLSLSQQGAGYAGLGAAANLGGSAIGATQAGTAGWNATNGVMQNGFGAGMAGNSSGAGIASSLYGQQLNAWGMQQQANASNGSTLGSLVGTGASLYL